MLRINLDGVFFTLRAAARHMVERGGGGSLAVTSSLAAIEGQSRGEHYAATKGAVISMIRAIAIEHARHGIRANAILPGWIETAMTERLFALGADAEEGLPAHPRSGAGATPATSAASPSISRATRAATTPATRW